MSTTEYVKYGPLEVMVTMVGERRPQFDPKGPKKGWYLYEVVVAAPKDYYANVVYLRSPDEHREAAQVTIEQLAKALELGSDWPGRHTSGMADEYAWWFLQQAQDQVDVAERWGEDLLKPAGAIAARRNRRRSRPHGWSPEPSTLGGSRLADASGALYTLVWLDQDGAMHRTDLTFDELWQAEEVKKEMEAEEGEGTVGIVTEIPYGDFMKDE